MAKESSCPYWTEYESLNGVICFCEVEAFGNQVSPAELARVGCNQERRSQCKARMEFTAGAAAVPSVVATATVDGPPEIARTLVGVSEKKGKAEIAALSILGILAGAYIAFGAQLSTLVTNDLAKYAGDGLTRLVGGAVFSLGLVLVVLGGAELFTGNSLMVTGLMEGKVKPRDLLRNWSIVYLANFAGALLVVFLMYQGGLWKLNGGAAGARAVSIAGGKVALSWVEAFTRGILCNWLVCLAVWLASASRDGMSKILSIVFPITAFVASGFEHSIANMYFIPMGIALQNQPLVQAALAKTGTVVAVAGLNWPRFLVANLIPVTLGNIVGGAGFVGLAYWRVYLRGRSRTRATAPVERAASPATVAVQHGNSPVRLTS